MSRGPEGDEADGSAVTRGRFAGRRKERARRWGDRDRATGRPKASRVGPGEAGRGGGRRGADAEPETRGCWETEIGSGNGLMSDVMVEIPWEIRGIRAVPVIFQSRP